MTVALRQTLRLFGVFAIYLRIRAFLQLVVAVETYEFGTGKFSRLLYSLVYLMWLTCRTEPFEIGFMNLHFQSKGARPKSSDNHF